MKRKNLKTKLKCVLFILFVFCTGQVFAAACGDVDSSGTVDIIDALMVAQKSVGLNPANFNSAAADVNADGATTIVDALMIAQKYVGLITTLPGCSNTPAITQTATPTRTPTPTATNPPGSNDCSNVPYWTATAHYETTGTKVYYNGKLYQNNWYSDNQIPEQNSGANQVWTLIGVCSVTPAPTPTPLPSVTWQGTAGYCTRFWDCCKPHCAWPQNVPAGMDPLRTCQVDGKTANTDSLSKSSCEGGTSYVCYGFLPWAVDNTLAYAFAATSSGDVCGKCFEMQFTGHGNSDDTPGAVALQGKRLIVQAINIGFDVGGGQFDILVPGGGVGAFNACSTQWGVSNSDLGAQYGGLLTACHQEVGYYDHEAIKNCLRAKNDALFRSKGLTQMATGLDWFIDWFEAADNPQMLYREIPCPQALTSVSGMVRP